MKYVTKSRSSGPYPSQLPQVILLKSSVALGTAVTPIDFSSPAITLALGLDWHQPLTLATFVRCRSKSAKVLRLSYPNQPVIQAENLLDGAAGMARYSPQVMLRISAVVARASLAKAEDTKISASR